MYREIGSPLRHSGAIFYTFLQFLAETLRPRSYFEIGTQAGGSLVKFTCDAVCVDPTFVVNTNVLLNRKRTFLFQMTSDNFLPSIGFPSYCPTASTLRSSTDSIGSSSC